MFLLEKQEFSTKSQAISDLIHGSSKILFAMILIIKLSMHMLCMSTLKACCLPGSGCPRVLTCIRLCQPWIQTTPPFHRKCCPKLSLGPRAEIPLFSKKSILYIFRSFFRAHLPSQKALMRAPLRREPKKN